MQFIELLKMNLLFNPTKDLLKLFMIATFAEKINFNFSWIFEACKRKPQQPQLLQEVRSEIMFERNKEEKKSQPTIFQNRMDAVIHTVSKIPSICHLLSLVNHDYLPYEFHPIQVDSDLFFQLQTIKVENGSIEELKFRLFSYSNESLFLQTYVETCAKDYERHMLNKLGTNKYYFDMMVKQSGKSIQNPLPTSYLMFTKHKFQTSRTFDNVFFEQKESIKTHTEFFLERRDWYEKKGIPHTLGFMFHGEPGCGKTSTIKAIANIGKRHIINIHLSEIKSKEQLTHLFFNDEIHVYDNGKTERYTIPVNERMYVIEDIDAMGEVVLKREWKKPEVKKEIKFDEFGNIKEDETNPIDLSFLLNLLDGTLESSGRIIALSTNFPERIDRALIRPGRVDMIVKFKKCSISILREMFNSFYDIELEDTVFGLELNYKWTPAEVNQILFRNFRSYKTALEDLYSGDMYDFSQGSSHTT